MDYLRREIDFVDVEIQGGPNMAVALMVWVGFLGASLATMERKHLAVDATERLLLVEQPVWQSDFPPLQRPSAGILPTMPSSW